MPDNHWDDQFKAFLKRAQDDLKRMGQDIRDEAQKLVAQVQDPSTQGKVRDGLRELGSWARRTAEDVAGLVEKSADRAESAFRSIRGGVGTNGRKRPSTKSVGTRKRPAGGAPKKKTGGAARKTVGRRPARR